MSNTAQATEKKKLFQEASAPKLPKLICTGYVARIGEGKESKSGVYNVNSIEIEGIGASRSQTVYLLTRPDWFEVNEEGYASFRPDSLLQLEGGKGMHFVYTKNIKEKNRQKGKSVGSISLLEGVCGNQERFENIQEAFLTTPGVTDENDSAEVIERILKQHLVAKDGEPYVEIGYVLKQQRTKTDEVDEDGNTIYLLSKNYELDTFWEVTEENKKKKFESCEKSAERAKAEGKPVSIKCSFTLGDGPGF